MNCNYDVLFNKIAPKKLDKKVEATIEILTDLPFCRVLNTRKRMTVTPADPEATATPQYNRWAIPDNVLECMPSGCKNTGTLVAGVEGTDIFRLPYDATEFAAGIMTFYVKDATADTIDVKISSDSEFTNADVYTVNIADIKEGADGYKLVVVDLSKTPQRVDGEGWTPSANGAYLSVSTDATMGISTIAIFDNLDVFNTSAIVKIGCLTEFGGDYSFDAAESSCVSGGYDDSTDPEIERTIVGTMMTPNYWYLNPMMKKGTAVVGSAQKTVEMTVEDGGEYGTITIPDAYQEECGFISAQIADACNVSDSELNRLIIPANVEINEKQFFVTTNEDGTTTLHFNKALVGQSVLIDYPQTVDVEEMIGNFDYLGEKRARIKETVTYVTGDGRIDSQHVNLYENVLITGFSDTINEENTEFTLTYILQRGKDGSAVKRYKVID